MKQNNFLKRYIREYYEDPDDDSEEDDSEFNPEVFDSEEFNDDETVLNLDDFPDDDEDYSNEEDIEVPKYGTQEYSDYMRTKKTLSNLAKAAHNNDKEFNLFMDMCDKVDEMLDEADYLDEKLSYLTELLQQLDLDEISRETYDRPRLVSDIVNLNDRIFTLKDVSTKIEEFQSRMNEVIKELKKGK